MQKAKAEQTVRNSPSVSKVNFPPGESTKEKRLTLSLTHWIST